MSGVSGNIRFAESAMQTHRTEPSNLYLHPVRGHITNSGLIIELRFGWNSKQIVIYIFWTIDFNCIVLEWQKSSNWSTTKIKPCTEDDLKSKKCRKTKKLYSVRQKFQSWDAEKVYQTRVQHQKKIENHKYHW